MPELIDLTGATIHFTSNLIEYTFESISTVGYALDKWGYEITNIDFSINNSSNSTVYGKKYLEVYSQGNDYIYYYFHRGSWSGDTDMIQTPPSLHNFDFPDLNKNSEFINWVLENNLVIEGGVYEEETPPLVIKNPLTIFTPATKVVGNDLVVNASEVEVVEDVKRGTFTFRGAYADDTSTGNAFFTIAFDIGSTWDDLINGKGNIEVTYESGSRFNSLVFSYSANGSDVNIKYTTTSGTTYTDIVALASNNTIVIGSDLVIDEGVYKYFVNSSGGGGQ